MLNEKLFKKIYETTQEDWEQDPFYTEHPTFSQLKQSTEPGDIEFVKYVNKVFPDSPSYCEVVRGEDDSDDAANMYADFFSSENYIYQSLRNPDKKGICSSEYIWDYTGDSKNPNDYYRATYVHSDGWNETVIMSYSPNAGAYKLGIFDANKIKGLINNKIDEIIDEDPTNIIDLMKYLSVNGEYGQPLLFTDNNANPRAEG